MIELRAYRPEDGDAVVALWWRSWHTIRPGLRHPQPIAGWRVRWTGEIARTHEVVVALDGGAVVGFAAADLAARELGQIFVEPGRVREGIGGRLLDWAKRTMPEGFGLHTLVENTASRAFYERRGLVVGARSINPVNGLPTVAYRWSPPRSLT